MKYRQAFGQFRKLEKRKFKVAKRDIQRYADTLSTKNRKIGYEGIRDTKEMLKREKYWDCIYPCTVHPERWHLTAEEKKIRDACCTKRRKIKRKSELKKIREQIYYNFGRPSHTYSPEREFNFEEDNGD
jgi:hypothetical protein